MTETHMANWLKFGRTAGPIRNQIMIEKGADLVIAFPSETSKGTRDMIKRAEAAGIPVEVHEV